MLYVANNGEACKDTLCQHPECWQSNIRRVRDAVRLRNGIPQEQNVHRNSDERFDEKKRQEMKNYSLPTLKIIDMTDDLATPYSSREQVLDDQIDREKCFQSSVVHQLTRPPCHSSLRARVPQTSPISPSLPEKHGKRWKQTLDSFNESSEDAKMSKINFHEIYDYDEVSQDWQDVFISTAYLVWCPSKKKKRKKVARARSAVCENRTTFKNPIQDVLPLPPQSSRKKPSTTSKCPTGGQPYSPCRSPLSRMYNVRGGSYFSQGEYIMTLAEEEVPKSLITSKKLIEHKPHTVRKDEQLNELEKSGNTKVLVDISATLATPREDKSREAENEDRSTVRICEIPKVEKFDKGPAQFLKQTSEFGHRKMLPLSSVAIPWDIIPDVGRQDHCKSSIPQCVDLDVMMEPVLYLPRSVSSSRSSRARAKVAEHRQAWKDRPRSEPSKETMEDRNHLTSAYRLSPKHIGTPAPTPASQATRDSRRHRSGTRRTNTKESLSRKRLEEVFETKQGALDGNNAKTNLIVRSSGAQIDLAIQEVAGSNQDAETSIGMQLSKLSLNQTNADSNSSRKNIETESSCLDKVLNHESPFSDRAVSPSSRTNIPSDIWAELRNGGSFDHRRITPRGNLDVRNVDRSRSLLRNYHSSLGLSIYSYTGESIGESNWKPQPPRLPKSLTYMGSCKPAVLPQMPAALTIVPVPSTTRTSHVTETSEVKVRLSSIRIPPVPAGSPVPNMNIAMASSASIEDECSTDVFRKTENFNQNQPSLESLNHEEKFFKIPIAEEFSEEYLLSREVAEETGVDSSRPDPLQDAEHQNAGSHQEGQDAALGEETLQDLTNSDKHSVEDTLRLLDVLAQETDELMDKLPGVTGTKSEITCTKSESTCPLPQVPNTSSKVSTKNTCAGTSTEENRTKDRISCTENEMTCVEGEHACISDESTCSEGKVARSKEDIVKSNENVTPTKDEITCSTDDNTCTKDELTCETREQTDMARDNTPVSVRIDENGSKYDLQDQDIVEEQPESSSKDELLAQEGETKSPDMLNAQTPLQPSSSTRTVQTSFRSLTFQGEDVRSILADKSFIPKVPSNFELEPYSVESELLRPIKIDSDLLLLSDGNFMDFSLEEGEAEDETTTSGDDDDKAE